VVALILLTYAAVALIPKIPLVSSVTVTALSMSVTIAIAPAVTLIPLTTVTGVTIALTLSALATLVCLNIRTGTTIVTALTTVTGGATVTVAVAGPALSEGKLFARRLEREILVSRLHNAYSLTPNSVEVWWLLIDCAENAFGGPVNGPRTIQLLVAGTGV